MPIKIKNRLLARMFFTSLSIIILVGVGLAISVNQLHIQSSYSEETAQLISELPKIAAELQENQQLPAEGRWIKNNKTPKSYMIANCDQQFNQVWTSSLAKERKLLTACEKFNQIKHESPPYYLTFEDNQGYFAHLLSVELSGKPYKLLVMNDASDLDADYQKFSNQTYFRLTIILVLALVLLISAAYWGMRPLRIMANELQAIHQGKAKALSHQYPQELEGITDSLNQLLNQSTNQQQRYQNAMNDLAHSLKTRLAAVYAITDDNDLDQNTANSKILEQVSQMDQLVKYQLKRAMVGRKGLLTSATPVKPIVDQITQMLTKIYQDKNINLKVMIKDGLTFPGDKGDLMELCGNLFENAYRLCISSVHINISEQANSGFQLIVEDDGPGIAPDIRTEIIERGTRADSQSPGQGIGLAVCHEIITSYNGQLTINSSQLKGACFAVTIPIK